MTLTLPSGIVLVLLFKYFTTHFGAKTFFTIDKYIYNTYIYV